MRQNESGDFEPSATMKTLKAIQEERMAVSGLDEFEALTVALVMYLDELVERGHLPVLSYKDVTE
jgi:hypothetical protein